MRHHLHLEADELDFFRVSKVAVRLVNDSIVDCSLDDFVGFCGIHLGLCDDLIDELTLEDEKLAESCILE